MLLLSGILFSSCFKQYSGSIRIDGSSTLYPLTEAVAEEYRAIMPDVKVTVGVSGTGGGFKKFGRNEIDILDASRPISSKEAEMCEQNGVRYIELPVLYDGLVVAVHPSNTFIDYLTVSELKKIWEPEAQGKIKFWNQIRSTWPNQPINLYGAGTSSGTYDYFTEAVVGKAKSSRGDYTASEDDNVLVQGLAGDRNGLAYFGLVYYTENKDKLRVIPIDDENDANGKGPVYPSESTIDDGTYQPLVRPEFIYINAAVANDSTIISFVNFYLQSAALLAKEIGAVPLQKEAYRLAALRFQNGVEGTAFKGRSHVGLNIVEVLKGN